MDIKCSKDSLFQSIMDLQCSKDSSSQSAIDLICLDPTLRQHIEDVYSYAVIVNHLKITEAFDHLCLYLMYPAYEPSDSLEALKLWLTYAYKELYEIKNLLVSSAELRADERFKVSRGVLFMHMCKTFSKRNREIKNHTLQSFSEKLGFNCLINPNKIFSQYSFEINEVKNFIIYKAVCREHPTLPSFIEARLNYLRNDSPGYFPLTAYVAFSKTIPKNYFQTMTLLKPYLDWLDNYLRKSSSLSLHCSNSIDLERRFQGSLPLQRVLTAASLPNTLYPSCNKSAAEINPSSSLSLVTEDSKPKAVELFKNESTGAVYETRGNVNSCRPIVSAMLRKASLQRLVMRSFRSDSSSSVNSVDTKSSQLCEDDVDVEDKSDGFDACELNSTNSALSQSRTTRRFCCDTLSSDDSTDTDSFQFRNERFDCEEDNSNSFESDSFEAADFYGNSSDSEHGSSSDENCASDSTLLPSTSLQSLPTRTFIYPSGSSFRTESLHSSEELDVESSDSDSDEAADYEIIITLAPASTSFLFPGATSPNSNSCASFGSSISVRKLEQDRLNSTLRCDLNPNKYFNSKLNDESSSSINSSSVVSDGLSSGSYVEPNLYENFGTEDSSLDSPDSHYDCSRLPSGSLLPFSDNAPLKRMNYTSQFMQRSDSGFDQMNSLSLWAKSLYRSDVVDTVEDSSLGSPDSDCNRRLSGSSSLPFSDNVPLPNGASKRMNYTSQFVKRSDAMHTAADVADRPKKVLKVTFAPGDKLKSVRTFQRDPEELLPDVQALHWKQFQKRIRIFNQFFAYLFTKKHRDRIIARTIWLQN